jgi:hypothetical protein
MSLRVLPLHDAALIFGETLGDKVFCGAAVGVSRRSRDVRLAPEAVSKITVAAGDVLPKRVTAFGLVGGEVMSAGVLGGLVRLATPGGFGTGRVRAGTREKKSQTQDDALEVMSQTDPQRQL